MIAFPVNRDRGLWSSISQHFGKAHGFIVVDLTAESYEYFDCNKLSGSGKCAPLGALSRMGVKDIFCRGLGSGALERCKEEGLNVFHMEAETVTDGILERNKSLGLGANVPELVLCRQGCEAKGENEAGGKCHQ